VELSEEIMYNLFLKIAIKWFETKDKIYLADLNKLIDSWQSESYIKLMSE
jgi:hypothetical protein